jgi:hypothetical protein
VGLLLGTLVDKLALLCREKPGALRGVGQVNIEHDPVCKGDDSEYDEYPLYDVSLHVEKSDTSCHRY